MFAEKDLENSIHFSSQQPLICADIVDIIRNFAAAAYRLNSASLRVAGDVREPKQYIGSQNVNSMTNIVPASWIS